jgi:signal transduction histidine kinase
MYRLMLVASFLILAIFAVAAAGIALWGAAEARHQMRRVELASAVLHDHLNLKAESYALLRRLSAGIAGTVPQGTEVPVEARERAAIQAMIDRIRQGIAREIAFAPRDDDETEELTRLAEIERGLMFVLVQYRQALTLVELGRAEEGRAVFDRALRELTGDGVRGLFDAAVGEEERETREAQAEAATALQRVTLAGQAGGLIVTALAGLSLLVLLRRLRRPLIELVEAAEAVGAGDLSRRVRLEPGRRDEFAHVATRFNAMVDEVQRSRLSEADRRHELEAAVSHRTVELDHANAELRRADAVRRTFLGDVSHELRTPITAIRGEAEMTLRGADRPAAEYRATLARIVELTQLTGQLVDDLLFVARAEAREPRLALQTVALHMLIRRCVGDLGGLAAASGVAIDIDLGRAEPLVEADPTRMRQAIVILIDNAVRYSRSGATVEVATLAGDGRVTLRVADQGIGIAPEELPHVFDRFWRGARASRQNAQGSGLGLPLARAIVEAHGGTITLQSEPGRGTIAAICLPALPALRMVS